MRNWSSKHSLYLKVSQMKSIQNEGSEGNSNHTIINCLSTIHSYAVRTSNLTHFFKSKEHFSHTEEEVAPCGRLSRFDFHLINCVNVAYLVKICVFPTLLLCIPEKCVTPRIFSWVFAMETMSYIPLFSVNINFSWNSKQCVDICGQVIQEISKKVILNLKKKCGENYSNLFVESHIQSGKYWIWKMLPRFRKRQDYWRCVQFDLMSV